MDAKWLMMNHNVSKMYVMNVPMKRSVLKKNVSKNVYVMNIQSAEET